MSYPGTSPWGPHGPQVPAHSVTPNPTPPSAPYVPSPSAPAPVDYGTSRSYSGGGRSYSSGPGALPSPKSVVAAVLLSLFIAPAAFFYASFATPRMLTGMCLSGLAIILMILRPTLGIPIIVIALIWSVRAVTTFNRDLAERKAAAAKAATPASIPEG